MERIQLEKHSKILITPKIQSLQSNNPDHGRCWRGCGHLSACQFHIFWDCPHISSFWPDIITLIKSMFNSDCDLSFSVIYLGNLPNELNKPDACPTIIDLIRIVEEIHSMESLTFSLRHDTLRHDTERQSLITC